MVGENCDSVGWEVIFIWLNIYINKELFVLWLYGWMGIWGVWNCERKVMSVNNDDEGFGIYGVVDENL